jgi:microcystin-dependent protein
MNGSPVYANAADEFGVEMPVGSIVVYAGSKAPQGWLMCDGALYDIAVCPELFKVVGLTYGSNAAKNAFRVPDLTGRVPVGLGSTDASAAYCNGLGQTGGQAQVSLSISEMPEHKHNVSASSHSHAVSVSPHNHTINVSSHTHTATASPHGHGVTDTGHTHAVTDPGHAHSINDPGHSHTFELHDGVAQGYVDDSGGVGRGTGSTSTNTTGITIRNSSTGIGVNSAATAITVQNATESVSVSSATCNASAQDTTVNVSVQNATAGLSEESKGSGAAHENLQPYIVLNYIIKY